MSLTDILANKIYRALKPHEGSVHHIQALFLWNRPALSALFLALIELLFFLAHCISFTAPCMICLVIGIWIFVCTVDDVYPSIFSPLKGFEIAPTRAGGSNRMRTAKEIAAFLATVLWGVAKVAELAFTSIQNASIGTTMLTVVTFVTLFLCTEAIGDFWFVCICFHAVFVLPGILATSLAQTWIGSPAAWSQEQDRTDKWMQDDVCEEPE
jgi:hypothetical protein